MPSTTGKNTVRIVPGSGGSFLAPPGHPSHFHHVEEGPRRDPNLIAGLDYAIDNEYGDVPEHIQASAKALVEEAELVCSEDWVRHVYGYFRNCYSPDGVTRNVSECVIPKKGEELPPAEHHLAYLLVKTYFPDHEPRLDLIADPSGGYGQRPCAKCGKALQYEARVDAWAEAITAARDCPSGGLHDPNEGAQ